MRRSEVSADDLLMGCLWALSRFGAVRLGQWTIDLEQLGIDWTNPAAKSEVKVAYSEDVVRILDRAAVLARAEEAPKTAIEHILVCYAGESGGTMGWLREHYPIDALSWRAAVAALGSSEERPSGKPAAAPAPARDYLTPEEGAEFLGIHIQTIRGYIRSGKLPAVRVAGERAIRIKRASLEALLEPLEAPVH
jgi:excisionase family DNA binding protein